MLIVVAGTTNSGKSEYAESLILSLSEGKNKAYIATMIPYGDEGKSRIKKHRKMRVGKGFVTYEKERDLKSLIPSLHDDRMQCGLLECVSNLVGNEIYYEAHAECLDDELVEIILSEIISLNEYFNDLIVVTNDFDEMDSYDDETIRYIRIHREVNKRLNMLADSFILKEGEEWIVHENN